MENPLSNDDRLNVNAIVEDLGLRVKTKLNKVKSSMEEVYKVLVRIGVIHERVVLQKRKKKEIVIAVTMRHILDTLFKSVKISESYCKL